MTRGLIALAVAATMGAAILPAPAQAGSNGGAVAAGVIGGLAVGSHARRRGRAAPLLRPGAAPVYVAPPPPSLLLDRGEPVWDGYRGAWVRPRVQVCD